MNPRKKKNFDEKNHLVGDVKLVQGGDPLYAGFFLHRALEAILDQNECVFLQKTTV